MGLDYSCINASPKTVGYETLKEMRKKAFVNLCKHEYKDKVQELVKKGQYYQLYASEYGEVVPVDVSDNTDELIRKASRLKQILQLNGNTNIEFKMLKFEGIESTETIDIEVKELPKMYNIDLVGLGVTKYENGDLFAYKVIENGNNWVKIRKQDVKYEDDDKSEYNVQNQKFIYSDNINGETKILRNGYKMVSWSYKQVKGLIDKTETDTFYILGIMLERYNDNYNIKSDIIDEYR